jgi:hypothetical protein
MKLNFILSEEMFRKGASLLFINDLQFGKEISVFEDYSREL